MATAITGVAFDVPDLEAAANFWKAAVSYEESARGDRYTLLSGQTGDPEIFLQLADPPGRTPQDRNPVHVDLVTTDDLDGEVDRLVRLGAAVVARHHEGHRWITLRDPTGFLFDLAEPY